MAAQTAKSLGIRLLVLTRAEDVVNVDKYRKLSSDGLTWFGEEKDHLKTLHELTNTGTLCKLMEKPASVNILFTCSIIKHWFSVML